MSLQRRIPIILNFLDFVLKLSRGLAINDFEVGTLAAAERGQERVAALLRRAEQLAKLRIFMIDHGCILDHYVQGLGAEEIADLVRLERERREEEDRDRERNLAAISGRQARVSTD